MKMEQTKITVLSFWPSDENDAGVGGFDWWPSEVATTDQVADAIKNTLDGRDYDLSVRHMVAPFAASDRDAITLWLDDETIEMRELPSGRTVAL